MIRDREHECMSRDGLKQLQGERLVTLVNRVYSRVPFYRDLFDKAGVKPEDIKGLDDLPKLPYSYKRNLRDTYPFGMFAVPLKEIVRLHASSGTTGKPTPAGAPGKMPNWSNALSNSMRPAARPTAAPGFKRSWRALVTCMAATASPA